MIKKMMLLAVSAAAVVAFAVPATASAEVTLLNGSSEPVEPGSLITAYSENTETTSTSGDLVCSFVGITGEVTENGPSVKVENNAVTVSSACTFAGLLPAHVNAQIGDITIEAGGGGVAEGVTFTSLITGVNRTCHFANSAMPVSWGPSTISVGGATNLTGSGPECPMSAEIHGDFGLFSDDGHSEALSLVEH